MKSTLGSEGSTYAADANDPDATACPNATPAADAMVTRVFSITWKKNWRKVAAEPSLNSRENLAGPDRPPPGTGDTKPEREFAPKIGWLNFSPAKCVMGISSAWNVSLPCRMDTGGSATNVRRVVVRNSAPDARTSSAPRSVNI